MTIFLRKIKRFIMNDTTRIPKGESSFFDLSSGKKAKIIRKATRKANEDQKRLVDEFDRNCYHSKA